MAQRIQHCTVCGKPTAEDEARRYYQTCSQPACRITFWAQLRATQKQRQDEQRQRIEQKLELVRQRRDQIAAQGGIDAGESCLPFVLPARSNALACLPGKRWQALREHLMRLVEVVYAEPAAATEKSNQAAVVRSLPENPLPIVALACATCGGYCCRCSSGDAHLNEQTLCRYRELHPATSGQDALQAYANHLGSDAYEDSCVFHAENGCRLPRNLRSDVCNHFECGELVTLLEYVSTVRPWRVFLAAMDGMQLVRWAFAMSDEEPQPPVGDGKN